MKKKLLLMLGCIALSTTGFSQITSPPYIVGLTKTPNGDCNTTINVVITAPTAYNAPNGLTAILSVTSWPYGTPTTVTSTTLTGNIGTNSHPAFSVSPSIPSLYTVTVIVPNGQSFTSISSSITVNGQRCYWDKGHFLAGYDDILLNNITFTPDNPHENPNLQVKWQIDEVDMQAFGPVHSIDNTTCWNDVNAPNEACTFKGFDGFNAAESIAELEAGNCSSDDGVFDPNKVYLITRSFRLPGDPWESYSLFIGPGTEDTPEDRSITANVAGTAADLFQLAQDRTAKTVTFQTDLHSGRFEIVDAAGRHMTSIDLSEETAAYTIDVAAFAKGLYVVRLVSGSQASTEKFVVE